MTGSDDVTIELEQPANVTRYDPTVGTEPVEKLAGVQSVALRLSDHPVVLVISQ